jgi:GT2 family glycosyltransferase
MSETPACSVVIPHLRGTRPLLACLQALHGAEPIPEIILIDNASTDDSVGAALDAFPGIRIVRAERNLGYAGAANLGLEEARGRWCIFLNDDAVVAPGAIEAMRAMLEEADPASPLLLQPVIRRSDRPDLFDYAGGAGGLIDRWGYPFALGRLFGHLERDEGQYQESGPLAWASGCCLAGASDVFRDLGGFEDSFFAHFEEIDLCWRHRRNGGSITSCPQAVVYHMGPSTLPEGGRKTYLNFRNNIWTLRRNLPLRRLTIVLLWRVVLDGAAAMRWLLMGRPAQSWAVLRGWFTGILRRPWRHVIPPRSVQPASAELGVYQGNVALAVNVGGIRSAGELLERVAGWGEPRGPEQRDAAGEGA